ncbi:cobyrinate a,c-diamide synthase [Magnetofaba australis]|uniref:Cobyrinate a,c-diamide synthase n=1 Tax=Magnetofaba australis IT-1 TaxID=1434232 RepID=A0A1Y2K716_9PROT|nr:cobyrinate a,c-diamide synthase [Magnetofaba australis]OSM05343.1 putative cobyrinate a,c-diamide synthase [Magnetofaba australis IT-1]
MTAKRKAPRFFVSGTRKSVGKTLVSVGLTAAFAQRGVAVQPFKKGPDYIDPRWLTMAAGRPCRNLDDYIMGRDGVLRNFHRHARDAELSIIEGNLGLFDGQDLEGSDCSAALADGLGAPVVLVVECKGMARGVAPLVCGHLNFPGGGSIRGIILNNVASPRQEARLRAALDRYCPVPIIGALPRSRKVVIDERHLGLVPAGERDGVREQVEAMGAFLAEHCDLDALMDLARQAPNIPDEAEPEAAPVTGERLKVAYAADRAFSFYYPENLEALERVGVDLIPINLLDDAELPPVDGIYIGGGFPEMFMEELTANQGMMARIREAAHHGMPIYAECGGLMYLSERIHWGDRSVPMSGALPIEVSMNVKPQGYGYMAIKGTGELPWPPTDCAIPCHEFHYSKVTRMGEGARYAYRVARGAGIDGVHDGVIFRNVLAGYAHIHVDGAPGWAEFLADFWRGHA